MSFTVLWTKEADSTFRDRIHYLNIHWTDREIKNFRERVREYLHTLKDEPLLGKKAGKAGNVYMGLIIKPVSLIYRVKPLKKEIHLIAFIDNRQDPKKIRKYKT